MTGFDSAKRPRGQVSKQGASAITSAATKYPLTAGPYYPPTVVRGDWLEDVVRGHVQVGGYSRRGIIEWPRLLKTGAPSLILCGDLVKAVRTESAEAIRAWFGVSANTVWQWRLSLGVDRQNNEGTQALYKELAPKKISPEAASRGRLAALTPESRAKIGLAMRTMAPTPAQLEHRRRLRAGTPQQKAHARERALAYVPLGLGKLSDPAVAKRAKVSLATIARARKLLGLSSSRHRPKVDGSVDVLVRAGLGNDSDYVVARRVGRSRASVRKARIKNSIKPAHRIDWLPELLSQLGKRSDGDIARSIGAASQTVMLKRRSLGIPAFKSPLGLAMARIEWPPEDELRSILESLSISQAAAKFRVSDRSIMLMRRKLKIGRDRNKQ